MAIDLCSEVKRNFAGQAVAGFGGVSGDGDIAGDFNFVGIDEVAADDPQEHHLDPLAALIAAEDRNAASIKAFAEYASLKEGLKHDSAATKAEFEFLAKRGKLQPIGGVR
ncbi:MAG: hypothetical protein HZA25_02930 [Candidatus Niyogibacteria bacterium]|nr:hypothetical protein [Candidatus Niyogibacteria bacterium]